MDKNVENLEPSHANGKVDGSATLKSSLAIPRKANNKQSFHMTQQCHS